MDADLLTIEERTKKDNIIFPYLHVSTIGLTQYINQLPGELLGLEIGTSCGESAYNMLFACSNIKKLYTVDPYKEFVDWIGVIPQSQLDKQREVAAKNLSVFGDRVEMVRKTSDEALEDFKDMQFDFIFVDGDHSYDQVLKDCQMYYPLLKKGGIFSGHDYGHLREVTDAINTFRRSLPGNFSINSLQNTAFYWIKE